MSKVIVIKIGSNLLADDNGCVDLNNMRQLVAQVVKVHRAGHSVILVSSGAIACGKEKLGFSHILENIAHKQAAASVGQSILMREYSQFFERAGITVAQVLMTSDAVRNKTKRDNIVHTFKALLKLNVIPIVNENDTVATDEIKFGDNDMLSAYVAELVNAQKLVIATNTDGLYDKNPSCHAGACLIPVVQKITGEMEKSAESKTSKHGTGGMATKLKAAKYTTKKGIVTYILNGRTTNSLTDLILKGKSVGTEFTVKK